MSKTVYIKSTDEKTHKTIFLTLYGMGYYFDRVLNANLAWEKYMSAGKILDWPYIAADKTSKEIIGRRNDANFKSGDGKIYTIEQFILSLVLVSPIQPIEVKLNNDYTAIVSDEHVKVGCQTFEHGVILELAEAVNKVLKMKE